MIACPVNPLTSLMTLASCTFIVVSAFCMCWISRPASCTCRLRSRHIVRIIRISSGGRKEFRSRPYVCSFNSHWLSCTSLFRPGRFLVSRAFVRHTANPRFCNTSYTATRRVGGGALSFHDAGHRPPLKRGVRFSRATLSRRRPLLRCNRRNQFDQLYQPILAVHFGLRQLFPAAVPPTFIPMRPNAPLDPTVEFVEERSDVGTLVVMTPTPQDRVQLLNQILGLQRHASPGKLTYPILEALNRFLTRVCVKPTRFGPSNDLARWQLKLLPAPDQVAQKF